MNIPFIITIRDGVVDTATVSTEETYEQDFLAKIKGMDPDGYTAIDEDKDWRETLIEDGYYAIDNASVCLTWIDVRVCIKRKKKSKWDCSGMNAM